MTLIHGAGVDWPGPRMVTYSAPSRANPPSPLKNSRSGGCGRNGGAKRATTRFRATLARFDRLQDVLELLKQAAALRRQNDPRGGSQKGPRFGRDQVGAQHEDAARRPFRAGLRTRLACSDQRLDGDLKLLDIGGSALVQDDEIDGELFHPPIFVRLQQFTDDVEMLDIGDAQKHDRQIAGNRPAATGRTARRRPARSHPRTGARPAPRRSHVQQAAETAPPRPPSRRDGGAAPEPASTPASKRAQTRWRRDACRRRRAARRGWRRRWSKRPRERSRLAQRGCGGGSKRSGRGRRRTNSTADGCPSRRWACERCGRGRGIALGRSRIRRAPTASPSTTLRCAAQISGVGRRPSSPRRHDRADVGEIFRLDEQFREGGMRDVGALRRQNESRRRT